MKLTALHNQEKPVSAISLFKSESGTTTAIQILKNGVLKEHITKVPALLLCIVGEVVFNDENGLKLTLLPGDYVNIEPMVKHWVEGSIESQLVLIK